MLLTSLLTYDSFLAAASLKVAFWKVVTYSKKSKATIKIVD